ncbi:MAG: PAS domain S-box protein [Candidatus Cyclobacteriaceae bacterium M3_2C_046]
MVKIIFSWLLNEDAIDSMQPLDHGQDLVLFLENPYFTKKSVSPGDWVVTKINAAFASVILDRTDEIIGKTLFCLKDHPDSRISQWMGLILSGLENYDLHRGLLVHPDWLQTYQLIPVKLEADEWILTLKAVKSLSSGYSENLSYQNLPYAYQSLDSEGKIILVNQQWCQMMQYEAKQVLNRSFDELLTPEFKKHFRTNFERFKQAGKIRDGQMEMINRKGQVLIVRVNANITTDQEGNFVQSHCFLKDVTLDRKIEKQKIQLINDFSFLSDITLNLIGQSEDQIYEYVGNKLQEKFPDTIVLINKKYGDGDQMIFNGIYGVNQTLIYKIIKKLGYSLENKIFQVRQDLINYFQTGKLIAVPGSFAEFAAGDYLSPGFAKILQRFFRIKRVFVIGFVKDQRFYAGIQIYAPNDQLTSQAYLLENLIQNASMVIQTHQAQKALAEHKHFLDNIIENLPLGLQVYSKEGVSLSMNSKQAELLGLPDKNVGVGVFNVLNDPFSRANGAAAYFQKVYDSKEMLIREYENNFYIPDNQWLTASNNKFFRETIFPILDQNHQLLSVITLLEDISQRKQAEVNLITSEKRWSFALEGSGDGIWDYDIITGGIYFSDQFKYLLGYQPDEFSDQLEAWERQVHPDDIEICDKALHQHLEGETEVFISEHRVKHKSGKYIWMLARGKIFDYDEQGNPIRFIGTYSDINDRKEMENTLRESEEKYRGLVEAMHDGVVLQDQHGRFVTCNKAAEEILGLSYDQIVGKASSNPKWKAIREDLTEYDKNDHPTMIALKTGKKQFNQIMGIYKPNHHGNLTWISVNVVPVFHKKQTEDPSYVVSSFFDITHIKKVENELKRSQQELLNLNTTKDKLFNIIGHDLKNPFQQLIQLSDFIVKGINQLSLDEIKVYAELIRKSSNQGHTLLVNLLEWSRSQTGKAEVNIEEISLEPLIRETMELLASQAYNKHITLNLKMLPVTVQADRNMLKTILRNLISNAIKFSYKHKQVTILVEIMEQEVVIKVIDQGTGMKPADQKKIFDLNAHFTTRGTENEKGSGLGLILTREFVEKMNGNMEVQSVFNQGSTFSVILPAI